MKQLTQSLLWLLISLAGCAPGPTNDARPNPQPPAMGSISQAAEKSLHDYGTGLADVAANTATRIDSGDLKDYAAVYDAFHTDSAKARETAMHTYEQAVTDRLKPADGKFDAAAAAKAFREVGTGFRKASAAK